MRELIFQEYVSLDGYAAGPGDDLTFFDSVADQADSDNLDLLETVDTMLLGANTYRLFVDFWPTSSRRPWKARRGAIGSRARSSRTRSRRLPP